MSSANNTVTDSPCYLCQRRRLHCHGRCKDYIAFAQYRQTLNQAKQDGRLDAYERYQKIQKEFRRRTR
ncbi:MULTISPECIES: hypothetical protein [Caproicibacterium]|uniref:Uncharacterized protein n=1 Tax=Caproicibacterium argilliputei TaxID=3030016 RepID=A0AA97DC17_9FIRM|nr:hypothetical protein [Caproicibacterium argilliputei]WOC33029.1 hypothetical protein PXC00_03890 [Caproicibacterium argilliputei]